MPSAAPRWIFGPFALDLANACLWRGTEAVALPPKAFDVLHYLVTHPDRLVTKDELLDAVWPETAVSDVVVRVAIGVLRKVLDDTRQPPRFIATVPRRGYRFLVPVTLATSSATTAASPALPVALPLAPPPLLVEREAVLHQLHTRLAQAQQGTRQVVFVTGEPGMGKTAVVETFAAQAVAQTPLWVTHGQCVEHYSTGEAYLPVLEALGHLCRAPEEVMVQGHPLRTVTQALQRQGYGTELALEGLSEAAVAAYLATRCLGHRFPETLVRWLHQRTEGHPFFLVTLVEALIVQGDLVQRQGRWVLQAGIEAIDMRVPESIGQMIEQQLARLSPEAQRVVEVASVAGVEFSAAAVAAGLPDAVVAVEERCEGLVRRQHWLRPAGVAEWPDGTVATRYRFTHWLYQHVAYQRLGVARRVQLHQCLGARGEVAYGGRVGEIAAELAVHFERGRDYRQAVPYLQQAAETALRRYAYPEAIACLTKGLELLRTLPESPERSQHELDVQITLGPVLMATKGIAAPEVETAYTRALDLCRHIGETPRLFPVLRGLWEFHQMRGEHQTARGLAEQLLSLAQSLQDPALLLVAHHVLGDTLFWLGELAADREHAEQGIALYDPQQHRSLAFLYGGYDPGVGCLCKAALTLWHLGYPDQALKRSHEALALAQELAHPYSLAIALNWAVWVYQFRREEQRAQERAEAMMALSAEQGFTLRLASGMILRGWALVAQGHQEEGIAQIRHGMAAWWATGSAARPSNLGLLAEAYGRRGQIEEGLNVLAEALAVVSRTGERYCEADLYRLKGEFLLRRAEQGASRTAPPATELLAEAERVGATDVQPLPIEAETCVCHALDIARHQQAKSLELRAALSLSRLWQQQGKRAEARQLLVEVYGWFTEGFDTVDLREARALLDELT